MGWHWWSGCFVMLYYRRYGDQIFSTIPIISSASATIPHYLVLLLLLLLHLILSLSMQLLIVIILNFLKISMALKLPPNVFYAKGKKKLREIDSRYKNAKKGRCLSFFLLYIGQIVFFSSSFFCRCDWKVVDGHAIPECCNKTVLRMESCKKRQ